MKNVFYKEAGLKKISSVLLLFVFTIGITPKKTLHNWFANHTDSSSEIPVGNNQQLTKAGYNCICDDLVAESHFIIFYSPVAGNKPLFNSFFCFCNPSFGSPSLFHINLRGPPLKFSAC
jgi:hypothetical protein